jgi:hypothetical protein
MLKSGDKAPSLVATSYERNSVNLSALRTRTVLWFSPKSTIVDEVFDKLSTRLSP